MCCLYGKNEERRIVFKFLIVYYDSKKVKNIRIMFEKLYGTYSGGTTQICFVQFLKYDLHIFVYNIPDKCKETE